MPILNLPPSKNYQEPKPAMKYSEIVLTLYRLWYKEPPNDRAEEAGEILLRCVQELEEYDS